MARARPAYATYDLVVTDDQAAQWRADTGKPVQAAVALLPLGASAMPHTTPER